MDNKKRRERMDYFDRKSEILDMARAMFISIGYEDTSINDLIKKLGIAKGTFYHYFKSKEELLNQVINEVNKEIVKNISEVASSDRSPDEKLFMAISALKVENHNMITNHMHKPENALLHQKTLNGILKDVTPYFEKIIEEGNRSNVFSCKYPKESMYIFLCSAINLLDDGVINLNNDEKKSIFKALIELLASMLGIDVDKIHSLMIRKD
ncbi:HTH-type transcriptional repressor KstR2 [Aedoeadaptatus ivorii]|uniref:HTH-type transcriptional repressor KstR2 n=1 Tax=Aedoeadaptatus ivorii TaxID=54006 RepID=A0A3S4Z460_9FIRM|nr:TetR/AcrR family transcriptional regulator [Peptoniphilus ivorii]VEJ35967.1 HTH-type transcriptional repressor KstR2 [Peptoniphilus ivorii]